MGNTMAPEEDFEIEETGERFVWDANKDTKNREKHGISFMEALSVFADPRGIELENVKHSTQRERRFLRIGKMKSGEIITVSYMWKDGVRRIITAHRNRFWRKVYEKENP